MSLGTNSKLVYLTLQTLALALICARFLLDTSNPWRNACADEKHGLTAR